MPYIALLAMIGSILTVSYSLSVAGSLQAQVALHA